MSDRNPLPSPASNVPQTLEWLSLIFAIITSVVTVGWVLWLVGFGYDFSDEGMYLHWMAHPHHHGASVTQFGFIYHPLYRLVGGDIALLRRANILLTLGLAWILSFVFFRKLAPADASWHPLSYCGSAFVLATSSLVIVRLWIPTPNYNSLTLQALLLAATGMLLADAKISRSSIAGWTLIGVSGWLTFMAKPTTAMALGLVAGLYLLAAGKFKPRLLAVSILSALALVMSSAWLIDGSIGRFAWRLSTGAEDAKINQGRHTLVQVLRIDGFVLSPIEMGTIVFFSLLLCLSTQLGLSALPFRRHMAAALGLIFSLLCMFIIAGLVSLEWTPTQARFMGLQYWAVPFSSLLAVRSSFHQNGSPPTSRERMSLLFSLAAFPHVYAFGTDANYWASAAWASIFWLLAGIVILGLDRTHKTPWRIVLPIATGAQVCTVTILSLYAEHPYRQTQPLRLNRDTIQIAVTGSRLPVSREFATYIERLGHLASTGDFHPETPMLDLTGHYPGALYALGAKPVGRPWLIGGYPGSESLAIAALDRVPPTELAKAWILTEPTGPRRISPEILKRYGLDLEKDYIAVGTLDSPTGSYPDSYKQHLLKPVK